MKTLFKLIVFLALTISMGCGSSKQEDVLSMDDTSAEVEKIKDHYMTWLKGAENGDVDAYFNAITDDFIYILAGSEPVFNRDSLRAQLETFFAKNTFSAPDMTTHDIEIWNDIGIHRYTASNIITSKLDSSVVELKRKYIDIYKKNEDGQWKAYLHLHFIID